MNSVPHPGIRVTDADRERAAAMLRAAADVGALTVDEFEERLAAAYVAVVRDDLLKLVADLPPSRLATAAPPAAPVAVGPSLFWLWCIVPYLSAASWVHAAVVTKATRYWTLAAVYAIPLVIALIVAPGTDDDIPGWVTVIAVVFWVANAAHVWIARDDVERRHTNVNS